jgi:IS30 family transposase
MLNPTPEHLAKYMARQMTSAELAKILNVHPVTIRRSIKRPKRERQPPNKRALFVARELYRQSVANKPLAELMTLLSVSRSTAHRIKAKYR